MPSPAEKAKEREMQKNRFVRHQQLPPLDFVKNAQWSHILTFVRICAIIQISSSEQNADGGDTDERQHSRSE